MDLAWISLGALGVVVVASCTTRLNPGVLAIVLAWVIGVYLAEPGAEPLGMRAVVTGFPTDLFLTLVGVTFLFTLTQVNGTLERIAAVAVRVCRGNRGLVPVAFFVLALAFASIGAGNVAAAALIAPTAMATAHRSRISPFLMMIMVCHGANAGALSPISPTGLIAAGLTRDRLSLEGIEWSFFIDNLAANAAVGLGGYLLLGGWRLLVGEPGMKVQAVREDGARFESRHVLSACVIFALLVAVIGFGTNVGMTAFAAAGVLVLGGLADEAEAIRKMPWGVILMVGGVTVLTSLLEATGGSRLFTDLVASISGPTSVTGVIALLTGLVSVYASSSGVVLPAFLPIAAGLAAQTGGDVMAIASSIVVGGHLVDASPLSTLGALAVASADPSEDRRRLFNQGLAWGVSMSVVGAAFCLVYFGFGPG